MLSPGEGCGDVARLSRVGVDPAAHLHTHTPHTSVWTLLHTCGPTAPSFAPQLLVHPATPSATLPPYPPLPPAPHPVASSPPRSPYVPYKSPLWASSSRTWSDTPIWHQIVCSNSRTAIMAGFLSTLCIPYSLYLSPTLIAHFGIPFAPCHGPRTPRRCPAPSHVPRIPPMTTSVAAPGPATGP